jgi:hypothetical protein
MLSFSALLYLLQATSEFTPVEPDSNHPIIGPTLTKIDNKAAGKLSVLDHLSISIHNHSMLHDSKSDPNDAHSVDKSDTSNLLVRQFHSRLSKANDTS